MTTKTITIGALIVLIAVTSILITLSGSDVQIKVEKTKSTFYTFLNDAWQVTGIEYNSLYNGTKKIATPLSSKITISSFNDSDLFTIVRNVPYSNGATILDTYTFSGKETKENFPISHKITIKNAKGLIYQYTANELVYSGPTVSNIQPPQSFGYNMKIFWENINYYSKITNSKGVGKLDLKYRISSNDETYSIRLFDPINCQVISSAGTYTLTENLQSNVTCFTITADDVILDGNGFNITGNTTGYGVNNTGTRTNLTVQNLGIYNFSKGVYFTNTNNSLLNNLTAKNNKLYGIDLYSSLNNNLAGITASNNTNYGIYIRSSSNNNTLTGITTDSNVYGIYISSGSNNILTSCVANSNTQHGIVLDAGSNSVINGTTNSNGIHGILIESSSNNIINSTSNSNKQRGITFNVASNNVITNLAINNSGQNAIYLQSVSLNNSFTNVTVINTNGAYYDIKFNDAGNNGTYLIDTHLANYSIRSSGSLIYFKDSNYGEIDFLNVINGTGTNLSADIQIGNNSVYVNSAQTGLNQSANVTLYGLSTSYLNPIILKDGVACNSSICTNFTSLNAGNVSFNVTGWSTYSIGERPLMACANLSIAGQTYTLNNSLTIKGTCFTLTGDNIVLDGAGFNITGDTTGFGVTATNRTNLTVKNLGIYSFSEGIDFLGTNNSLLNNLTVNNNGYGIILLSSNNNQITNSMENSNSLPLALSSYSNNNVITNLKINNSGEAAFTVSVSSDNNFTNVTVTNTNPNYWDIYSPGQADGTYLIDTHLANYSFFGGGSLIYFKDTNYGEIRFLNIISGTGTNLSADIQIGNNSVYVNSAQTGLNQSANITLYGLSTSYTNPKILKNGLYCLDCFNFTSLNAGTVKFNVTSWTNYSIGEYVNLTINFTNPTDSSGSSFSRKNILINVTTNSNPNIANITINLYNSTRSLVNSTITTTSPNYVNITVLADGIYYFNATVYDTLGNSNSTETRNVSIYLGCGDLAGDTTYTMTQSLISSGTCFTLTGDNIVLDGAGFNITGDTNGHGVYAAFVTQAKNITIKNLNIYNFNDGIYLYGAGFNDTINNVILNNNGYGLYIAGESSPINNQITNIVANNNNYGIYLGSGSNNNFVNITANNNWIGFTIPTQYNNLTSVTANNNSIYSLDVGADGNYFIDSYFSSYNILSSLLYFKNTNYGEIKFSNSISGSGANLSDDIMIESNRAYVNSSQTGLNQSANISLYNLPTNFSSPTILRDGVACSSCQNFTSLNAGNVSFSVTGWSNYSIGENKVPSIDYLVVLPLGFLRFLNCSPDFENSVSIPQGQSSLLNSINATNNGTGSADLQIRINQTAATGWTLFASNQSDLSQNLTLGTSWQTIYSSVSDGIYRKIWLFANCSHINSNPRTGIELQAA